MNSYKCTVAYEGTRYNGWQKQGNTNNTIQEKIEEIMTKMLKEPIAITASGRTDAGVHALGQVFHFHMEQNIPKEKDFLTESNNICQRTSGFWISHPARTVSMPA